MSADAAAGIATGADVAPSATSEDIWGGVMAALGSTCRWIGTSSQVGIDGGGDIGGATSGDESSDEDAIAEGTAGAASCPGTARRFDPPAGPVGDNGAESKWEASVTSPPTRSLTGGAATARSRPVGAPADESREAACAPDATDTASTGAAAGCVAGPGVGCVAGTEPGSPSAGAAAARYGAAPSSGFRAGWIEPPFPAAEETGIRRMCQETK